MPEPSTAIPIGRFTVADNADPPSPKEDVVPYVPHTKEIFPVALLTIRITELPKSAI